MTRLRQPRDVDKTQLEVAYELLRAHGQQRRDVKARDGQITTAIYKAGIPVKEIAQSYEVSQQTVYDILSRAKPPTCHPPLSPGDACTSCGTVEVAS